MHSAAMGTGQNCAQPRDGIFFLAFLLSWSLETLDRYQSRHCWILMNFVILMFRFVDMYICTRCVYAQILVALCFLLCLLLLPISKRRPLSGTPPRMVLERKTSPKPFKNLRLPSFDPLSLLALSSSCLPEDSRASVWSF